MLVNSIRQKAHYRRCYQTSCRFFHSISNNTSRKPALAMGDLNNTSAMRIAVCLDPDPAYSHLSYSIPESEDDPEIRQNYRPFLLDPKVTQNDWISKLELSTALRTAELTLLPSGNGRLKVLVLYGSLRQRSYSRLLAYEASRILFRLGCDVRVFNPAGLPVKDDVHHGHPKVQELRDLSKWSDGHLWICPEQHGIIVSIQ
jgi:arsenic resistance protein ArsH